jgi:hypothetical protein
MTSRSATRSAYSETIERIGESIAYLGTLTIAAVGWYIGALFTLLALETIGIPISQLGEARWLIPGVASTIEIFWWPGRTMNGGKRLLFVVVGGIDLLSTVYGVYLWSSGRFIPLGTGFTIPAGGIVVLIVAAAAAIVLTFGPERLARWAGGHLYTTWFA